MEKQNSNSSYNRQTHKSNRITFRINIVRFWQITALFTGAIATIFCILWLKTCSQLSEEQSKVSVLNEVLNEKNSVTSITNEIPQTSTIPTVEIKDYNVEGVQLTGKRIIIDPGHGGDVPGGTTGVSGKKEKEINLEISLKIKELLESEGANVIMTRETDEALGATWEEDMQAREKIILTSEPDMFLSIHQNEFKDDPTASGPQVFFVKQGSIGKRLAVCIQDMLNYELKIESPRIPLEAAYRVLKPGTQPSCTVECGFMSNAEEEAKLKDPEYQKKVAQSIVNGIKLYVKKFG